MIVTIDPNKLGCGVAVWNETESKLVEALYVECEASTGDKTHYASDARLAWCVGEVKRKYDTPLSGRVHAIIERPRVYPGVSQKDLNDLIDVACVGAACATFFKSVDTVYPSEWKGTVKKRVMLERIRVKLTAEEEKCVKWSNKSNNEDILDAIGIGLWHFGRLNQKVYPGAGK